MATKRAPQTDAPLHPRTRPTMHITLSPVAREALHELSHDERLSQSAYLETLVMREWARREPKD